MAEAHLVQELLINHPRCIGHHLIHPSTMPHAFAPFGVRHNCSRLVLHALDIGIDAYEQVDTGCVCAQVWLAMDDG